MLAIDPVGLIVTALLTAALVPGRWRLAKAAVAVVLGEACRVLAAVALSGTVVEMTMGGALSRYVVQSAHPVAVGLLAGALTVAAGLLLSRSLAAACGVYALVAAVGLFLPR